MGLAQMAQHFRETEPWASDPADVRKFMVLAVRAESEGNAEKAEGYLGKAIAATG
jgi:hypothetical protein